MLGIRDSGAATPNPHLRDEPAQPDERNVAWLDRVGQRQGVLLVGGASVADVRLRFAQSRLRSDLTPSHWTMAGLLDGDELLTVPLAWPDPTAFAAGNGVVSLPAEAIDDPALYPNLGIVLFGASFEPILAAARDVRRNRAILDLPALTLAWLGAVWAVSDVEAPLREGQGIPSAAFVHLCHAIAGLELTPGMESTASCPEAIWQAARWWTDYYRESATVALRAGIQASPGHAQPSVPAGAYTIRSRLVEAAEPGAGEVDQS